MDRVSRWFTRSRSTERVGVHLKNRPCHFVTTIAKQAGFFFLWQFVLKDRRTVERTAGFIVDPGNVSRYPGVDPRALGFPAPAAPAGHPVQHVLTVSSAHQGPSAVALRQAKHTTVSDSGLS